MCYHFKLDATADQLLFAFQSFLPNDPLPVPTGDFYPISLVPVIRQKDDGQPELLPMEWGLLPSWWQPSQQSSSRQSKPRHAFQRHCFNARYETVDEKPAYREAFQHRRCLVPVTQFEENNHYFSLPETSPEKKLFAFAGIWESWQDANETILSCTFLTTEANAEVEAIGHDRMPLLLRTETEYHQWLNPDINSCASLTQLLYPANDGVLTSEPKTKHRTPIKNERADTPQAGGVDHR